MASGKLRRRKKSLWSQTAPSARLAFGAFFIVLTGAIGMLPREIFGIAIAWPFAALWGAMGWGKVGLAIRPMILLLLFGLMQDIVSNAPLGCFAVINLAVYGLSAGFTQQTDGMRDAFVAVLGPVVMLLVALLFVSITRLAQSGTMNVKNAVGRTGEVYIPVPAARSGRGKVSITLQGALREIDAKSTRRRRGSPFREERRCGWST